MNRRVSQNLTEHKTEILKTYIGGKSAPSKSKTERLQMIAWQQWERNSRFA